MSDLFRKLRSTLKNSATDLLGGFIPAVQFNRCLEIAMAGQRLTTQETKEIEKQLQDNPHDLNKRILLLGRYGGPGAEAKAQRLRHIRWLVENDPAHAIAGTPYCQIHGWDDDYQQIKSLWIYQLRKYSRNAKVQANAASYFIIKDKELAEQCLKAAIKLSPSNEEFRSRLSHLYSLWDGHESEAFDELEKLCQGPDSEDLFCEMSDLPSRAFDAKEFEKATKYANRLIELCEKYRDNWNYGNAWNEAHTVLGRIAFKNGDIDAAKRHLHLSSIDIGTPQTRSFGPSLDLAKDLATARERDAVIEYLDAHESLCGVDNDWAFQIRYRLERDAEDPIVSIAAREHYDDCKIKHQLDALKNSKELRDKHLANLLKRTIQAVDTWERRAKERSDNHKEESIAYAIRTHEAQKQHLEKLQQLAQEFE
jgi:hypothetical protein